MQLTTAMILTIDTETTGTSTREDRIVELGGVYLQAGQERGPRLRALVDPERYIPAGATGVHGIRDQDVEGAPKWAEVAARFKVHLDQNPVVCGYNILFFDAPLIDAEMSGVMLDGECHAAWIHSSGSTGSTAAHLPRS